MIRLSKRGLGIALIVSLGVNLFLAGMMVTAAIYSKGGRGWSGHDRPYHHRYARRALKGESLEKVDKIWGEARPDLRMKVREMRRSRREVRRQLRAETLDRPALDRAFTTLRDRTASAHGAMQTVIGRIAETLNAEERRAYFRRGHWRRNRRLRRPRE